MTPRPSNDDHYEPERGFSLAFWLTVAFWVLAGMIWEIFHRG
jgi:hypothetical protein